MTIFWQASSPADQLTRFPWDTHCSASLYEAFEPAEARRLVERFEWHDMPKHGSWLNLAESELAILSGQCLDRRIPDAQALKREVDA